MKPFYFILCLLSLNNYSIAQMKFIVEDFEGLAEGASDLKPNGIFVYGNIKANIESNTSQG